MMAERVSDPVAHHGQGPVWSESCGASLRVHASGMPSAARRLAPPPDPKAWLRYTYVHDGIRPRAETPGHGCGMLVAQPLQTVRDLFRRANLNRSPRYENSRKRG